MTLKKCFLVFMILGLAACAHAPQKNGTRLSEIVAKVGDSEIRRDQLQQEGAAKLMKWRLEEYDILKETLDHLIEEKLIEAAAAAENKTAQELLKEKIDKKIAPPADAEIQNLYQQYKSRMNNQTLEQAKPMLIGFLQKQQSRKLYNELINELRSRTPITILLEPLRIPVAENGRPAKGPETAPIKIIEFSDYECSFCGRAEETVKTVHKVYGNLVRIIFRDYPLSFHPHAQKAAEAAACAALQNRFWEMHEKLFQNSENLAIENLNAYARELGLDMDPFEKCLSSGGPAAAIAEDLRDGSVAGVSGTPAFFINGRFLSGAQPFNKFAEIIDEELARAGIPIPPKPADWSAQP